MEIPKHIIKMIGKDYGVEWDTEEEFRDILLPENGYYRVKDVYMNMDTFETVLVYDPNCCATHNTVTRYDYIVENEMKKLDELLEDNVFLNG